MKTIAIIAPTGMLGSMLYAQYKDTYKLVLVNRSKEKIEQLEHVYGKSSANTYIQFDLHSLYEDYQSGFMNHEYGVHATKLLSSIGEVDTVINCAGIIKPDVRRNSEETLVINSYVPHILSLLFGEKLIHLTTDCVFSGEQGAPYTESSLKTPNDLYGLSKSLGEPSTTSLVLRTSIIGPEIVGHKSLLAWCKKQKDQTVEGYTTHLWNGLTTKQLALSLRKIIDGEVPCPKAGLYHLFSSDISKCEMLQKINEKYNLAMTIDEAKPSRVDRRLRSIYSLCSDLKVPPFDEMLKDL